MAIAPGSRGLRINGQCKRRLQACPEDPGRRRRRSSETRGAVHDVLARAIHWPRHVHSPQLSRNGRGAYAAFTLAAPRRLLANADAVYRNPILGGDHPDASPIRVGNEFFLTHSSFDYAPGLLIWRSHDLVNWRPVAAALHRYAGSVWAPYLSEYEGRFYIYFPADNRLRVVHADHPLGPWSEPIDLGISAIDPAHIAENGRRFLYANGGVMAELTADGLGVKAPPRHVFDPWPVPASMRIECTCLEAPKLIEHNGYFYLNVAEGGTAGPSTSHAVVSAVSPAGSSLVSFAVAAAERRCRSRCAVAQASTIVITSALP